MEDSWIIRLSMASNGCCYHVVMDSITDIVVGKSVDYFYEK